MNNSLLTKLKKSKIIILLIMIGSFYGFFSAIFNQNPYYPPVGHEVENKEQMVKAWHWEPSPVWFPSYLACKVRFGIEYTKSGYVFHSQIDRVLYFAGSIVTAAILGFVLALPIVKLTALKIFKPNG